MEEVEVAEKKQGWSWLGFFFAPHYYAGYGNVLKGSLYAVIGAFPLFGIIIAFIAGKNARKELPVGQQEFKWANVVLTVLLSATSGYGMATAIDYYKNSQEQVNETNNSDMEVASEVVSVATNKNVDFIKQGTLEFDKSITVGQAFDNYSYFSSTDWTEFTTDNGKQIVEVRGTFGIEYLELQGWAGTFDSVVLVVQFQVNLDSTFEISSIEGEVTKDGQTKDMDIKIMESNELLNRFLKELYNNKALS